MLLDTCSFIWLLQGGSMFPEAVRRIIYQDKGPLFISAISAAEIGIKQAKGDLLLPVETMTADWFERAAADLAVGILPINSEIAWKSSQLPWHHRDPFDRIILSTAEVAGLKILTPDRYFLLYDEVRVFWE